MGLGRVTAAALLVVLTACARCSRPAGAPPERFLQPDAPLSVVIPTVRVAQEQLAAVTATALTFAAVADQAQALAAAREQLGFDPLDPRSLEGVGVDVARGAGVSVPAAGAPLLVLPVGDEAKLEALVARLARDRLGASRRERVEQDGHTVHVYRSAPGGPPALSMAFAEGDALLVTGADGPTRIAAALSRPTPGSLASAGPFVRARKALGASPSVIAYAPPGTSAPLGGTTLLRDGAALGLSGAATRVTARGVLLLAAERRAWWKGAVDAGGARDGDAPGRLPADAFLVGRMDGDVATLLRRALPLAAAAQRLQRAGLDLERDVLEALGRGAAVSLAVAPTFQVASAGGATDLLASDPLRLVHLSAVLHVKDASAATALLDRLVRAGPQLGLRVSRSPRAAGRWRVVRGDSAVDVALDGRRLLVGGGPGRLDALLAPTGPRYAAPTDAARSALSDGVAGGVLDFQQLVSSFRALPSEAYGTGPDAFVMRSLADRIIEPASRMIAGSVRVELGEDAAAADVVLEAKAVEAKPGSGAAR